MIYKSLFRNNYIVLNKVLNQHPSPSIPLLDSNQINKLSKITLLKAKTSQSLNLSESLLKEARLKSSGWNISKDNNQYIIGNISLDKYREFNNELSSNITTSVDQSKLNDLQPFISLATQVLPNSILIEDVTSEKVAIDATIDQIVSQFKNSSKWENGWILHILGLNKQKQDSLFSRLTKKLSLTQPSIYQSLRNKSINNSSNNQTNDNNSNTKPVLIQLCFISKDKLYISIAIPLIQHYFQKMISYNPKGGLDFFEDLKQSISYYQKIPVNDLESSLEELVRKRLPSRSYLKLHEMQMRYPDFMKFSPGQTVVDIGSSPGGWSLFALERSVSKVISIDKSLQFDQRVLEYQNSNLTPSSTTTTESILIQQDGEQYVPNERVDWLLVDMKVPPMTTLRLLKKWLVNRWINHYFIVTLKFEGNFMTNLEIEKFIKEEILPLTSYLNSKSLEHGGREINLFGTIKNIN